MKVLFQGAGAIGIAGAALFGDRHEALVVSRATGSTPDAANSPGPRSTADAVYPRRVRSFGRGHVPVVSQEPDASGADRRRDAPGAGRRRDVASIRRVPVADWAAASSRSWDLVVLTTRPGDLDDAVATSILRLRPATIAITSQVDGDRDLAASIFPESEILVFSPALLSERTAGRNVRYWQPPGMPVFMASGRRETVRRLRRELGGLIVGVPAAMISGPPTVFIPYAAELSLREGSWSALRTHLRRPTRAAAEAVHAVTGVRVPISAPIAGLVLEALERFVPIDVSEYAGRHFGRHEGQTLDMLDGWITGEAERSAEQKAAPATALREEQTPTPALSELAQALRPRVTR